MDIGSIITTVVTGVTAVVSAGLAIIKSYKAYKFDTANKSMKDVIENVEKALTKAEGELSVYKDSIMKFIEDAEGTGMTGSAKLVYVKSQVLLLCNQLCLDYDDAKVTDMINNIISLTKKVNTK